jgi:hypothetical protein
MATQRGPRTVSQRPELEGLEDRTLPATSFGGHGGGPPPHSAQAMERPPASPEPNHHGGPQAVRADGQQALDSGMHLAGDNGAGVFGQGLAYAGRGPLVNGSALASSVRPFLLGNALLTGADLLSRAPGESLSSGGTASLPGNSVEATSSRGLTQVPLSDSNHRSATTPALSKEEIPGSEPGLLDPWLFRNFGLRTPLPSGNLPLEQALKDFWSQLGLLFSPEDKETGRGSWAPWIVALTLSVAAWEVGRRMRARHRSADELAGEPLLFPGWPEEDGDE